jgi:hypothetical protein
MRIFLDREKLSIAFFGFVLLSFLFFAVPACQKGEEQDRALQEIKPPVAQRIKKELTTHGHTRVDYYYWLNQKENPKVKEYLKAENEYKEAVMKHKVKSIPSIAGKRDSLRLKKRSS